MPPLADAVGFVHGHEAHPHLGKRAAKQGASEALRRHIEQLQLTGQGAGQPLVNLGRCQRAVDQSCGDALPLQRRHLVGHQRDQWRDD